MHHISPTATALRLGAGIITEKLAESKAFYTEYLGFKVRFEDDWILLLYMEGQGEYELGFLMPNHPTQAEIFRKPYGGQGIWLVIEVDDVDAEYRRILSLNIPVAVEIRDEPWGDRHFVITDPNGIGVDIVHILPQLERNTFADAQILPGILAVMIITGYHFNIMIKTPSRA